jgi:membrane protein DedA with SNARE-associated domain
VALPAALGVTVGSLVVYGIAYWCGKPVLVKWGTWLGLSWNDIERLQQKFETSKNDELALFILRVIPFVPSVAISAFYGLVRFNIKKYFLYSFLGTCIRALILGIVGWQVGSLYQAYAGLISHFEIFIWIVLGVFGVAFLLYRLSSKKRNMI